MDLPLYDCGGRNLSVRLLPNPARLCGGGCRMGRLDDIDLKVNPEPRAACLLLLDTSGSMDGARIAELQEGLRVLQNDLLQDSLAQKRVEIGIVTFGDTVRVAQDFVTARELQVPSLAAGGN